MIVGDRVRQARTIKGLTQKQLADLVGVRQPAVAQFEHGSRQPSPETLEAIAFATAFPVAFFSKEQLTHFPFGTLLFRGKTRMSERERTEAHELAAILYEAIETLAKNIKPLPIKIPLLSDRRPSDAAELTRSAVGLSPHGPVRNLIHHLESAGVCVIAAPKPLSNRDGFSAWTSTNVPVIALSPEKPGDRQRWSATHELGHLVMHRQIKDTTRNLEREADAFAAAFLMPDSSIRPEMGSPTTLVTLARLKPRWGVSIAALAMQASRLGALTDGQLRYLYVQLSKHGWRTQEPENLAIPIERPRAFKKMAELLYGIPVDVRRLAADLALNPGLLKDVLDVQAEGVQQRAKRQNPRVLGFKD
jgi:Zn-dependent peptidase ImmA (M78 family)/DNA-binding XRE family transcriptional regulator